MMQIFIIFYNLLETEFLIFRPMYNFRSFRLLQTNTEIHIRTFQFLETQRSSRLISIKPKKKKTNKKKNINTMYYKYFVITQTKMT